MQNICYAVYKLDKPASLTRLAALGQRLPLPNPQRVKTAGMMLHEMIAADNYLALGIEKMNGRSMTALLRRMQEVVMLTGSLPLMDAERFAHWMDKHPDALRYRFRVQNYPKRAKFAERPDMRPIKLPRPHGKFCSERNLPIEHWRHQLMRLHLLREDADYDKIKKILRIVPRELWSQEGDIAATLMLSSETLNHLKSFAAKAVSSNMDDLQAGLWEIMSTKIFHRLDDPSNVYRVSWKVLQHLSFNDNMREFLLDENEDGEIDIDALAASHDLIGRSTEEIYEEQETHELLVKNQQRTKAKFDNLDWGALNLPRPEQYVTAGRPTKRRKTNPLNHLKRK